MSRNQGRKIHMSAEGRTFKAKLDKWRFLHMHLNVLQMGTFLNELKRKLRNEKFWWKGSFKISVIISRFLGNLKWFQKQCSFRTLIQRFLCTEYALAGNIRSLTDQTNLIRLAWYLPFRNHPILIFSLNSLLWKFEDRVWLPGIQSVLSIKTSSVF